MDIYPIQKSLSITYLFPGKVVERQNDKIGITADPNREYRIVECSAYLTSAEIGTLNTAMMPASAPTYDATDPKVRVYRDGTNYFDILCVVTGLKLLFFADNKWLVQIQFTERST